MADLTRRGFLSGLFAAAVATQLPSLPEVQVEPLIEELTNKFLNILINGQPPEWVRLTRHDNNWIKVEFGHKGRTDGGIGIDFTGLNNGKGLFVGTGKWKEEYLKQNPGHVASENISVEMGGLVATADMVLSMFVKLPERT